MGATERGKRLDRQSDDASDEAGESACIDAEKSSSRRVSSTATASSERFTTYEGAELLLPRIIKQSGVREPFNEDKLRSGMLKALEKRPVSAEKVEEAISHINHKLRASGEREVPSKMVGELVMSELHRLDEVAYVRFASVYREFKDVRDFVDELEPILNEANRIG